VEYITRGGMMKVKNINGTSDNKCKCGSWILHWEKYSGKKATSCSELNCLKNSSLVGAHVQKEIADNKWYIVPLCSEHNKKASSLEIKNSSNLVPANVSETCGK
jgi:hypothetical protein